MGIYIIPVLLDIFIWWRLITDLRHRGPVIMALAAIAKGIISVILITLIISLLCYKGEFADPTHALRTIQFGTVAALTITIGSVYILISTVVHLLERLFHTRLSGIYWLNMALACLACILIADGYFRQRFNLKAVTRDIVINGLDPRLNGMKILLMSDLHLSSFDGNYDRLSAVMSCANSLGPDIIINAGDFITYGWQEYGGCDTILKRAAAQAGSFAVTGNHDDGSYHPGYDSLYATDCREMISAKIKSSGYILLHDTSVTIIHRGVPVKIAGTVTHGHHLDMSYGDFRKAINNNDTNALTIYINHDPAVWDDVLKLDNAPALTLAGHTHGMQVGIPTPWGLLSPASYIHKYWRGLYSKDGKYLYVSTGLGTMGMADRIFMPPEIVLLILKSK